MAILSGVPDQDGAPEDVGTRWRQLRELFVDDPEFKARYPAACKLLFDEEPTAGLLPDDLEEERSHEEPESHGRREYYTLHNMGPALFPDIPELATRWLEELNLQGLPEKEEVDISSCVLSQACADGVADQSTLTNTRSVRLGNGQVLQLQMVGWRSRRGYKRVEVLAEPRRTDAAILAALTVLEGRPIKPKKLLRAMRGEIPREEIDDNDGAIVKPWGVTLSTTFDALRLARLWVYARVLLQYYRPADFDILLIKEEQAELTKRTCVYIHEFLESLRKLMEFLEYGVPGRDTRPVVENARRDVWVAVLRDVDGLKEREIAQELGIKPSPGSARKNDYSAVREMTKRGRKILERAWGKDGWERQIELLKVDAERYRGLSDEEKAAEFEAETSWMKADGELIDRLADATTRGKLGH